MENIIKTKTCKHCLKDFEVNSTDIALLKKLTQTFGGKNYEFPVGNLCHHCKEQRKMSFRNERILYHRTCDLTGKPIISTYSPDKQFPVYGAESWWSDDWDPMKYGQSFDINQSFFKQFESLYTQVPKIAIFQKNSENSPYSHFEADQKNCYMTVGGHRSEDCRYMTYGIKSKDTQDVFWAFECENCYEIINSYTLQNCQYLEYSENCRDCRFGYYLKGCQNCIGCAHLTNKQYCIFNKQYSKEEYQEQLKTLGLENRKSIQYIKKEFEILKGKLPHKFANLINVENVTGTDIFNSKNVENGFLLDDCEDIQNCSVMGWARTAKDNYAGGDIEKAYENMGTGLRSYNVAFCILCYENRDVLYSTDCHNSSNLFGCVGLRNKQYCILNTQYTQKEYELLIPKIIARMQQDGEWGEFFPSSMSPLGYNETVAQDYYPLTPPPSSLLKKDLTLTLSLQEREQKGMFQFSPSPVIARKDDEAISEDHHLASAPRDDHTGPVFNWSTYDPPHPQVKKTIPGGELPDTIDSIPDDILNWAIECEATKKPFKIIQQELEFYRKHKIPVPTKHPNERHLDRMRLRTPNKLYTRSCDKCTKEIQTTYAPERPEIVYCEECYNKEVY